MEPQEKIIRRAVWNRFKDHPRRFKGKVRISTTARVTHGAIVRDCEPCARCGCRFVNVACPKIWPIGTVALSCSECGRVLKYVDGLLVMSVTDAIRNMHGREWAIRRRMALEVSETHEIDQDVVMLALDAGMTMDEIVTALDMQA